MKPYQLVLFLYVAESAYCVATSNGSQVMSANWTHVAVRKPLNTTIIAFTFDTVSLMGCASACTWSTRGVTAPSLNFEQDLGKCHCNNALDDTGEDRDKPEVTYGIWQLQNQNEASLSKDYNADCNAHFKDGYVDDGFYKIRPSKDGPIKDVYCLMSDEGWTRVQFRESGSTDVTVNGPTFNRSWTDYVNGFGSSWVGLETLHELTKGGSNLQIILMTDHRTHTMFYTNITVGNAASNYTLYVNGYRVEKVGDSLSSDLNPLLEFYSDFDFELYYSGDSLSSHNGMPFSVPNGDNECADACAGGWWYRNDGNCGKAILNLMSYGNSNQCPVWATGISGSRHLAYSEMFVWR